MITFTLQHIELFYEIGEWKLDEKRKKFWAGRYFICRDFVKKVLGEIPNKIKLTISDGPFKDSQCAALSQGIFWMSVTVDGFKYPLCLALTNEIEQNFWRAEKIHFRIDKA